MDLNRWMREITDFVVLTWGPKALENLPERAARILEEAAELAQAQAVPRETAMRIIDRVYSRPIGNVRDEEGDVMFTLLAHTAVSGTNLEEVLEERLQRVNSIPVEVLRARHVAKRAAGTILYEE